MVNKIVFAAGGTGGHIYPAIAIADEIRKMNNKAEIKFIGAKGRIEEKIIPANGYELKTIDVKGFYRSISPKNVSVTLKFLRAERESKNFLRFFEPEIVFGTGGFVSGPVLWAATKLKIPSVIQEGNSYPGITVKWLSGKVDKVILNFEDTKKYLKRTDNTIMMSYPVRSKLVKHSRSDAAEFFGLVPDKKTLFAFGGSQGAHSINEAMLKSFKALTEKGLQIIWQTGTNDYDMIYSLVGDSDQVKVLQYIENIEYAYSACDLVICRGGVSTVMELASFGCAALIVPFAAASENHQEKNARSLVEKGAAEILLDKELTENFESKVMSLVPDENKLEKMRTNIKTFADNTAAGKIAEFLSQLAEQNRN